MFFLCVECKTPVTASVSFTDEAPPEVEDEDGWVDYPRQGLYTVGDPLGWQPELYPGMSEYYVFNMADVINTTQDSERMSGCCGSDGMNGINLLCPGGHEIGIEFSDCWQAYHYVQVPPDKVERVEQ